MQWSGAFFFMHPFTPLFSCKAHEEPATADTRDGFRTLWWFLVCDELCERGRQKRQKENGENIEDRFPAISILGLIKTPKIIPNTTI